MKKKVLSFCDNIIIKNQENISNERLEIINYGLESLYLTFTKIFIIIILSIILGIVKETIILILFYNIIRLFAFGMHAPSSIQCLVTSIVLFIGGTYLSLYLDINLPLKIVLSAISLILIIIYAPADTEKRPLINKKKRKSFKILSIFTTIIMITFILLYNNNQLSNFILIGLIEETIMILPITYKLFKLPYNNYKTYKQV